MCVLVTQLYLALCDPRDCSPPDSSVHGIFQARMLKWVASSFSRGRGGGGVVFPTQGSNLVLPHLQAGSLPEIDKKICSVIFSALRKPSEFPLISPPIGGNNRRCLYGGGGCTRACWKPRSDGSELCLGDDDFCKRSDESFTGEPIQVKSNRVLCLISVTSHNIVEFC